MSHSLMNRRRALACLMGGSASVLAGCASDGSFSLLGYTSTPNYDPHIRTVYVPLFKTKVLATTPYREMEITLTRFVVDAIESRTPMKVVSDPSGADSELQGTVLLLRKNLLNRTPFNGARELELALTVEVVWHDLRPGREGRILSNPKKREPESADVDGLFDPSNPPPPKSPDNPAPVSITAVGRGLPELGETSTSALNMAMKSMAIRITHAMERGW